MLELLKDKYREAHHVGTVPEIKYETCCPHQSSFCIKDGKDYIICPSTDEGVSVYDNSPHHYTITIIDFENFINQFKPHTSAGTGKKCDFLLYDEGDEYIILNELSALNAKYLEEHEIHGQRQEGKRSHAIKQIKESIKKLVVSPDIHNYINQKKHKIGMFSYKITIDENMPKEIQQNLSKFSTVKTIFSNINTANTLSDDFVFEQRIFPTPFTLK